MKKFAIMAMAAASLASTPLVPGFQTEAEARTATARQFRAEGRRECRSIPSGWQAIVRGYQYGDRSFSGDKFSIRYCFTTQAECAYFVNSAENIIYPLQNVTYRNCRPY